MDYIYLMQYDSRPDTVKLGIGRGGEASSYQTGAPERDAKMIFTLLTPDPGFIESIILKEPNYSFAHEWTNSDNISDIKAHICHLHNHKCNQDKESNYQIIDGWDVLNKLKPSTYQRPHIDKHVKDVAKQIKEKGYLLHPILATEDYKITDGNHRFRALQLLKSEGHSFEMPVIINKNSDEKDFVSANVGTKNLAVIDYIRPYALQGFNQYEVLAEKLKIYSGITPTVIIRAFSKNNSSEYKKGEFELGEYGDIIMDIIININEVTPFNSTKSAWSNSINKIVRNNKNIDKDKLVDSAKNIDDLASEGDIKYYLCLEYNRSFEFNSINNIHA